MKELGPVNPVLEKTVIDVIEDGNALVVEGAYEEGLAAYEKAWSLLPDPKAEWEMLSNWIAISFFDAHLKSGQFQDARKWALVEMETRPSDDDYGPFMDLGIGHFELQELPESHRYFAQAYQLGGARAFKEYPKKYYEFFKNYPSNQ